MAVEFDLFETVRQKDNFLHICADELDKKFIKRSTMHGRGQ